MIVHCTGLSVDVAAWSLLVPPRVELHASWNAKIGMSSSTRRVTKSDQPAMCTTALMFVCFGPLGDFLCFIFDFCGSVGAQRHPLDEGDCQTPSCSMCAVMPMEVELAACDLFVLPMGMIAHRFSSI